MKIIKHKFVEYIPSHENLEDGVVYISIEFDTAVHKCFCGCGQQVVTPISPTDWKITYNGESISLYPSIGNWAFDCQSHYWIKKGEVVWAESWSKERIQANREVDTQMKEYYFEKSVNKSRKSYIKFSWLKKLLRIK